MLIQLTSWSSAGRATADWCNQCELYIWDVDQQQWGDGTSFLLAQNRYLDSWAGNRDGRLVGTIRSNFHNYLDANKKVRFLIYGERGGNETFHDYASLTVKQAAATIAPDSFTVEDGTLVSGGLAELAASDNADLSLRRSFGGTRTEFQVKGVSPVDSPSSFEVTFEGSVTMRGDGVTQTVELFDYDAGEWEVVDSRLAKRFDTTVQISLGGDLSRFVEANTRCIEAKISYDANNPRTFSSNTDLFIWTILP